MKNMRSQLASRIGGELFDKGNNYKFAIIKALKKEFKQQFPKISLLDMGVGEPDEKAPECVTDALKLECAKTENRFYADNGTFYFLKAVADYMQKTFNVQLDPSKEILHSMGIKAALSILAGCLINPGDIILTTSPGYDVFAINAAYYGGNSIRLPLEPQNCFLPDITKLPEETLKKIKVFVLNYPNNPTGKKATYAFLQKVVEAAHTYNWVLVQDAAYAPLSFKSPLSLLQIPEAKNVAVELHSMSKGFNMTGWRLGWVCGNETLVSAYGKFKDTVDSGQFLAIQKAAIEALKNAEHLLPKTREKYWRRYKALAGILIKCGITHFEPEAGFFVYAKAPKKASHKASNEPFVFKDAAEFTQWLLKTEGVLLVPWDEAGAFMRFSLTFEAQNLQEEEQFFTEFENRLAKYFFE